MTEVHRWGVPDWRLEPPADEHRWELVLKALRVKPDLAAVDPVQKRAVRLVALCFYCLPDATADECAEVARSVLTDPHRIYGPERDRAIAREATRRGLRYVEDPHRHE